MSSAMTMNLTRVEMYRKTRKIFPQRAKIGASVHPVLEPTLKLDVRRGGQIQKDNNPKTFQLFCSRKASKRSKHLLSSAPNLVELNQLLRSSTKSPFDVLEGTRNRDKTTCPCLHLLQVLQKNFRMIIFSKY